MSSAPRIVVASLAVIVSLQAAALAQCQESWVQVATSGPGAQRAFDIAYDAVRDRIVLFGGPQPAPNHGNDQLWEWDGARWEQRQRSATWPPPRYGHTLVYDAARGRTVLFGGYHAGVGYRRDLWEWDGASWTLRANSGPDGRYQHRTVYDPAGQRIILYGGAGAGSPFYRRDTWAWDGEAGVWTRLDAEGPARLSYHAMAFDGVTQRIILMGGFEQIQVSPAMYAPTNRVWEWTGSGWMELPPAPWSPRASPGVATNDAHTRAILVGGQDGFYQVFHDDGWERLAGSGTWSPLPAGPGARYGPAITYDSLRRRFVLYAGIGESGFLDDTWVLTAEPVIVSHPESASLCPEGTVTLSVTALGTGPFTYQWQRDGQDIDGATSPMLTLTPGIADESGAYRCVVSNSCASVTSQAAVVTVCLADADCNGVVTSSDISAYLTRWLDGVLGEDPLADFNRDGVVNSSDISAFLTAWLAAVQGAC